jgi:hypothetical protein
MKISLVFENTGDVIPFKVVANHELVEWFIKKANKEKTNSFSDDGVIGDKCNQLFNEINWALSKTNEVLFLLYGKNFPQFDCIFDYLNQDHLNKQHELWVFSQQHTVDIDKLRFSADHRVARIGNMLHDQYPDDIRQIKLVEAMIKLGYIFPYEEVNLTVHRLEGFFNKKIEFKSSHKWEVFENPFRSTMTSNNDHVNLSFGYTYVGRQYHNKWKNFDSDLKCLDHYNYETLEWAFQLHLIRPETISYSPEFLAWCKEKDVEPITDQIPLANIIDLEKNLEKFRTILYKNSRAKNRAKLLIQ